MTTQLFAFTSVIRKVTPDNLDGEVVDGPMDFETANAAVRELNDKPVDGSIYVIAAY